VLAIAPPSVAHSGGNRICSTVTNTTLSAPPRASSPTSGARPSDAASIGPIRTEDSAADCSPSAVVSTTA
jgi:hypothetical protein